MARKLFVGGLSWGTDQDTLLAAFQRYGCIEAKVVTDRETGRSKGFGFVTFERDEDADAATHALNDTDLHGRKIRVSPAVDKPRDNSGSGGYRQPLVYDREQDYRPSQPRSPRNKY